MNLATALRALPFALDLWQAQNIWYELSSRVAGEGEVLRNDFLALGAALNIRVDRPVKNTSEVMISANAKALG